VNKEKDQVNRSARTFLGIGLAVSSLALGALPVSADNHEARVRVLHASPDAPAVDIYVDDSAVDGWTSVAFGTLSDYMSVPGGDYNVKVYPTGETMGAVIDADVSVEDGISYTIAATGLVSEIEPVVFTDNPDLSASEALVRVIHLSPDAPAVDVARDGADALISDLAFPDETDYAALAPDAYDLEVRIAGESDVALQLDPIELEAGHAYSVFAIGSAAADPAGGNALDVVIAVDGRVMPDTAIGPDATGEDPNWWAIAALLALGLAVFAVAFKSRYAFGRR
jgi:hypothetical protein